MQVLNPAFRTCPLSRRAVPLRLCHRPREPACKTPDVASTAGILAQRSAAFIIAARTSCCSAGVAQIMLTTLHHV